MFHFDSYLNLTYGIDGWSLHLPSAASFPISSQNNLKLLRAHYFLCPNYIDAKLEI